MNDQRKLVIPDRKKGLTIVMIIALFFFILGALAAWLFPQNKMILPAIFFTVGGICVCIDIVVLINEQG